MSSVLELHTYSGGLQRAQLIFGVFILQSTKQSVSQSGMNELAA